MKTTPARATAHALWTRDLAFVVAGVAAYLYLATVNNWSEKLGKVLLHYEALQVDEWPVALLMLSIGLAWFAWRRMGELKDTLRASQLTERRLAQLLEQNRQLAQRLITVQEEERIGLARELHDEFGQSCTAIRVEAQQLLRSRLGGDPSFRISAESIAATAAHLHDVVRGMLANLRPPQLDDLGIDQILQEMCESWESQSGIACLLYVQRGLQETLRPSVLDRSIAICIYRLVQEALSNVARHAHATQVKINLKSFGTPASTLQLSIEDDGVGLAGVQPEDWTAAQRPRYGLLGMRERTAALHGDIAFLSAPSGGVLIKATLPLPEHDKSSSY